MLSSFNIKHGGVFDFIAHETLNRQQAGFLAMYILIAILNTVTLVSEETRLLSLFVKFPSLSLCKNSELWH